MSQEVNSFSFSESFLSSRRNFLIKRGDSVPKLFSIQVIKATLWNIGDPGSGLLFPLSTDHEAIGYPAVDLYPLCLNRSTLYKNLLEEGLETGPLSYGIGPFFFIQIANAKLGGTGEPFPSQICSMLSIYVC